MSHNPEDWSNAKKARTFFHIIGHLAVKFGHVGELRIPMSEIKDTLTVGFDRDGDDLLIAVDMDEFGEVPPTEGSQRAAFMEIAETWGKQRDVDVQELLFRMRTKSVR